VLQARKCAWKYFHNQNTDLEKFPFHTSSRKAFGERVAADETNIQCGIEIFSTPSAEVCMLSTIFIEKERDMQYKIMCIKTIMKKCSRRVQEKISIPLKRGSVALGAQLWRPAFRRSEQEQLWFQGFDRPAHRWRWTAALGCCAETASGC